MPQTVRATLQFCRVAHFLYEIVLIYATSAAGSYIFFRVKIIPAKEPRNANGATLTNIHSNA